MEQSSYEITDIDLQLALKLKDKYPEHFQNLIRMHLSFALDLNIENNDDQSNKIKSQLSKWSFCKKTKTLKDIMSGTALTETKIARIYSLILFLSKKENICQEGIFRKTGAVTRQLQLKTCLNEGVVVDFNDNNFTIHDCASVLKNFLSELPEPLVTDVYYPLYCQISEWCKCNEFKARLLRSLQLLILLLPTSNALLLKHIINLLHITSKYAKENKMSAENLATLFTPHILCPRKLSGEVLHANARMLHQIVVFMIECGPDLFKIPAGFAADIRLYWHEKEKKKLSPKNCLNESMADSCVVNTIFSFVDREKTAQENTSNPTETALAQLYAHIQSLPDSSKKRKLVKQFNKENGYGTPKRVLMNNNDKLHSVTRNISDSLKKHIFNKNTLKSEKSLKSIVKNKHQRNNLTLDNRFKTQPLKLFDKGFDCMNCECSDTSNEGSIIKKSNIFEESSSKHIQEKLVSFTNNYDNENDMKSLDHENRKTISKENNSLSFSDSSLQKESIPIYKNTTLSKLSTPVTSGSNPVSSYFCATLTSTPAPVYICNEILTPSPFCGSNEDMSPITMSTQKMPRSMQEVMMTPRSRQPVLAVSSSNNTKEKNELFCSLNYGESSDKGQSHSEEYFETCISNSKEQTKLSFYQSGESLTDTFREYLFSRSMLTTSFADDSFSSRTGDFDPSSVSEDKISDSLLYCLDGGTSTKQKFIEYYNSFSNETVENIHKYQCDEDQVHETLL